MKLSAVVGLDLAGVETRPTGLCVLKGSKAVTSLVYLNQEILDRTEKAKAKVVAIDAPLSLPPGMKSIEDRTDVNLRACDKELVRRGIKFFPITLDPMKKLTKRGLVLRKKLESLGFKVIEVYPGGAQDVLDIPRKKLGLDKLKAGLENLGISCLSNRLSDHELDAVTCAFVGKLFLEGKSVPYGYGEDVIIMPEGEKRQKGKN